MRLETYALYLLCEVLSLIFLYFACKFKESSDLNSNKRSKIFFILSLLPFVVLFIFRNSSVGRDFKLYSDAYLSNYNNTLTSYQSSWLGIGFRTLCSAFGLIFGKNYMLLFALINITILFLFQYSIYKESKHPVLSLMILYTFCFHLQIFNQFRQFLAISICFWSLKYLKNNEIFKFSIGIIIASLFHSSAIILLLLLIFNNKKINAINVLTYFIIGMFFIFGFRFIENLIGLTHYGVYIDSTYDIQTLSSKMNLIVRIILMIFCLTQYKNVTKKYKGAYVLYHMSILCVLFQILATYSYILARLTTYFYISYVYLLPLVLFEIYSKFKQKNTKIIFVVIVLMFLFIYKTVYYYSPSGAIGGKYDNYKSVINFGG